MNFDGMILTYYISAIPAWLVGQLKKNPTLNALPVSN